MHDTPDQVHWHEPKAGENAGLGAFKRPQMPYDRFMEAEGVPVYRGIGVRRVQDLPLAPWKRLGGRGSYIQLYGTEGLWGLYVVEIPAAGALNEERHLYEKVVLVVEGRGSTEVWQEGQTRRHAFEWQAGSLFTIPLNARHRLINAANAPALLLCGTSAPNVMNLFDNVGFVFNCPSVFSDRFSGADDYFKPRVYLDANVDFRFRKNMSVFLNARNLTNVAQDIQRYAATTPSWARTYRREEFGVQYTLGLKGQF